MSQTRASDLAQPDAKGLVVQPADHPVRSKVGYVEGQDAVVILHAMPAREKFFR